jgi:hypothetical protein
MRADRDLTLEEWRERAEFAERSLRFWTLAAIAALLVWVWRDQVVALLQRLPAYG